MQPQPRQELLESLLQGTSQATLDCLATQPLNAISLSLWVTAESVSSVPLGIPSRRILNLQLLFSSYYFFIYFI
jgi:hypothetical protein